MLLDFLDLNNHLCQLSKKERYVYEAEFFLGLKYEADCILIK